MKQDHALQEHYNLLCEKLVRLRKSYAIEVDPLVKFKLEKQIEEAEVERGIIQKSFEKQKKQQKKQLRYLIINVGLFALIGGGIIIYGYLNQDNHQSNEMSSPKMSSSKMRILIDIDAIEVMVGTELLPLKVENQGTSLTYQWELFGPGQLEGPPLQPIIFYRPPITIEQPSVGAIIIVHMRDENGREIKESVSLKIIKSQANPPSSPSQIVLSIPSNQTSQPVWMAYREIIVDNPDGPVMPAPEPTSLLLVGIGIIVGILLKKRSRGSLF